MRPGETTIAVVAVARGGVIRHNRRSSHRMDTTVTVRALGALPTIYGGRWVGVEAGRFPATGGSTLVMADSRRRRWVERRVTWRGRVRPGGPFPLYGVNVGRTVRVWAEGMVVAARMLGQGQGQGRRKGQGQWTAAIRCCVPPLLTGSRCECSDGASAVGAAVR